MTAAETPGASADPLDTLLRTAVEQPPLDLVQLLLRDAVLDVALDDRGKPLVVYSPDNALCLIVTTGAAQRDLVPAAGWQQTDLLGLITLLDDGVDVLANPYGPVAARIHGDDVRGAWLLDNDALEQARAKLRERYPAQRTGGSSGHPAGALRADPAASGRPGDRQAKDW